MSEKMIKVPRMLLRNIGIALQTYYDLIPYEDKTSTKASYVSEIEALLYKKEDDIE